MTMMIIYITKRMVLRLVQQTDARQYKNYYVHCRLSGHHPCPQDSWPRHVIAGMVLASEHGMPSLQRARARHPPVAPPTTVRLSKLR